MNQGFTLETPTLDKLTWHSAEISGEEAIYHKEMLCTINGAGVGRGSGLFSSLKFQKVGTLYIMPETEMESCRIRKLRG